ncbi:hypothetical protein F1188_11010 [Roseospira marina]|uniref:Uncharacterized protein n=1 Tax=Roseospira marina TaxID=140057 RepID=A0A5M6IAV9_9PROT|nr:hypothetical protein [Roseospira marina]KAA5605424.1 hypothetical protein F1188_11010 [Roseospira marina]MBB4314582.1 hypothetical protein [Roseospira marina]MBB5088856.1 hypothetical protein [Roseospira marina]
MAVQPPTVPQPPRLTGNAQADNSALADYMWSLYKALVLHQGGPIQRISALSSVETPDVATGIAVSAPPTQSDVEALVEAVQALNATVTALVRAARGE